MKALKRRPGKAVVKKDKKRRNNIIMLVVLLLTFTGFTLYAPRFANPPAEQRPQPQHTASYIGTWEGSPQGTLTTRGVVGSLSDPEYFGRVLKGEVYPLDAPSLSSSTTQLLLTNANETEIRSVISEDVIVYQAASCGNFTCLLGNTSLFDVYSLDPPSNLTGPRIGFPASEREIIL